MTEKQDKTQTAELTRVLGNFLEISAFEEAQIIWRRWREFFLKLIGMQEMVLFLYEASRRSLGIQESSEIFGNVGGEKRSLWQVPVDQASVITRIFNNREVILENGVPPADPARILLDQAGFSSLLGGPLNFEEDFFGALVFFKKNPPFEEAHKKILAQILPIISPLIYCPVIAHRQKAQLVIFDQQKDYLEKISQELRGKQAALEEAKSLIEKDRSEMERLVSLKTDFISAVSHELRTPLTTIKESISLLQDNSFGPLSEVQKKFVSIAKNNIDRLSRLINNLLDFSKIEAGKLKLVRKVTRLDQLVNEVSKTVALDVSKKKINFSFNVDESLPPVFIDPDRIFQVLLNLVGNAIKFTPSGGQITLEVKQASDFEASSEVKTLCPPGGDYVLFAVTDTGIGIKEEEQAKLFRKFQQVDSGLDRHFGGVGLGLVISKGFVESHGGAIWLASRYKHGAKFQFAIPLKPVPVILVVDDEKNIVEVIARLLAGSNYHVLKASDGVEALAVVAKAVPDLIIMDIKMPRMDGYQLVKSLKSEERTNKIPILILSGYTVDTGLLKACGLNLFRSIAKPFDSGELLLEVEMILRGE